MLNKVHNFYPSTGTMNQHWLSLCGMCLGYQCSVGCKVSNPNCCSLLERKIIMQLESVIFRRSAVLCITARHTWTKVNSVSNLHCDIEIVNAFSWLSLDVNLPSIFSRLLRKHLRYRHHLFQVYMANQAWKTLLLLCTYLQDLLLRSQP